MPLDLHIPTLIARYESGETLRALATTYSCSEWAIKARLKLAGVVLRRTGPARRYALDETFFDDIDTEAKAYWLGFILADGCVSRAGGGYFSCRINLAVKDRKHLEKAAADLKSTAEIKSGHAGRSCYIDFCSARLCRQLIALSCGPNKTGNHGTPDVSNALKPHFYRGYFDGDGSLFYTETTKTWAVDVVGATAFIEEMQQWLLDNCALSRTQLQPTTHPDVSSLRYQGGTNAQKICDVLYAGATIYLDRKYKRYQHLLTRNRWPAARSA